MAVTVPLDAQLAKAASGPPRPPSWAPYLLAALSPVLAPLGLVCLSLWTVVATLLEGTRFWNGASLEELAVAERALFATTGVEVAQFTVCGLHTVAFQKAVGSASAAPADSATAPLHPAIAFASAGGGEPQAHPLPPLLLLHGYGSGSGLWLHNARDLLEGYAGPVLAVDWRGTAGSLRTPAFPIGASREEAESWMCAALEAWRAEVGCDRVVLVGHSLGGYLAASYATRYPARVAGLFLVSPVGVHAAPSLAPQDRKENGGSGDASAPLRTMRGGMFPNDPSAPAPRQIPRFWWGVVSFLWNRDWTPGRLLRNAGPFARGIAQGGIRRRRDRFVLGRPLTEEMTTLLGTYLFHANATYPGSGEFVLRCVLAPGAWAREAVGPRLVACAARLNCPVAAIYGKTHDWMNADAGDECMELLRDKGLTAACFRVSNSGHHCYLENPDEFNPLLLKLLRNVKPF